MTNCNDRIRCSVIVCTHNRANSLAKTLRSVLKQDFQGPKLEVIVIDNGSTDGTKEKVETIGRDALFPVMYCFEPILGLSNARNTGLYQARGDIVVFIDDDAIPHKNWIKNLLRVYDNSEAIGAGGDAIPLWPYDELPVWFHRSLMGYLGLTNFNYSRYTELHYPSYPHGVNISFRRKVVKELGGFSAELGRKGKYLLSGEETELCYRIEKTGGKIFYVPDAVVDHVIDRERLTKSWFRNRAFYQGLSKASIEIIGSTRIPMIYNVVRRINILYASTVGTILFSILCQPGLAFTCECKMRMSWGYILRVFEAWFKIKKSDFKESNTTK